MEENIFLEELFTRVPGRPIRRPGREAIVDLPPRVPQPDEGTTANIMIKQLDPIMFPILSRYTAQMLNALNTTGLLNRVIGLNVNCNNIRKYQSIQRGAIRLDPPIDVFDIVPKEDGLYAFILPYGHYIVLRHIRDNWFRALAYFQFHHLYTRFLDIYFTNRIIM
jgi:hypothetical protein